MVAVPSTVDMAMKEEGCTLSFSQILQFVQNGQEIPGTRNLDIIPNNLPLTVSQMARKHKPWETRLQSLSQSLSIAPGHKPHVKGAVKAVESCSSVLKSTRLASEGLGFDSRQGSFPAPHA
uniref:Peroxisomal membrane protein PEX14-like KPWE domain-containing protein n=1 Tax=Callorhinchus milii TaxID=7868 RepID=A0A4W3JKW8_CALMI